jgi:hypothetical protein
MYQPQWSLSIRQRGTKGEKEKRAKGVRDPFFLFDRSVQSCYEKTLNDEESSNVLGKRD